MKFSALFLSCICIVPSVNAQTIIDVEDSPFVQDHIKVEGRIRQITLAQAVPDQAQEIIVNSRRGTFPKWKSIVEVYHQSKSSSRIKKHSTVTLPEFTIYYGFFVLNEKSYMVVVQASELLVVMFEQNKWRFAKAQRFPLKHLAAPWSSSSAVAFSPLHTIDGKHQLWIPTQQGYELFSFAEHSFVVDQSIALAPKSFYRSSSDILPFEISYWFRNVYWFPTVFEGSLDGTQSALFSPWMDEMDIVYPDKVHDIQKHYFSKLSEQDRDDGSHYLINSPIDLNGDGRTDFVLNEFQGTGINLRSSSYYYMTSKQGKIASKGIKVPLPDKKIAGALVQDINIDGKQDFIIVSSPLSVWSMIRALTKRQIEVQFDVHLFSAQKKGYDFEQPDISRDILFDFSLKDFFVDGVLPSLEGDFNGDGLPDIMYATHPKELTFLIQDPKQQSLFQAAPSRTYRVDIAPKLRIGDVTGDGASDLIFFDTRSGHNRSFTVLRNNRDM